MVETLLYTLMAALLIGCLFLLVELVRKSAAAKRDRDKINWVYAQVERALGQIKMEDENEILAGLQTIVMLSDSNIRFEALPRLNELAQSDNSRIASYAREAIKKLIGPPRK